MLIRLNDVSYSVGDKVIFKHLNMELKGREHVALTGRNGCGKTTLLRILAGELDADRDDKRKLPPVYREGQPVIGWLKQHPFEDMKRTAMEEFLVSAPDREHAPEAFAAYEQEALRIFTGMGFALSDSGKCIGEFSGGEQTRIALISLLLVRPDILLLDEPTNHLDVEAVEWLEDYLNNYRGAVLVVSHDRYFLNRIAKRVIEISDGKAMSFAGNYRQYREQRAKLLAQRIKANAALKAEQERLEELIKRFKNKPTKAAMTRAKRKQLERLGEPAEVPGEEGRIYAGEIVPELPGSKWPLQFKELVCGYRNERTADTFALKDPETADAGGAQTAACDAGTGEAAESDTRKVCALDLRIRRGQKIAIVGRNGSGKTTLLKTAAGKLQPLSGKVVWGNQISAAYFDQHSAEIQSEKSVIDYFRDVYPTLTDKEARTFLAAFLFDGRRVGQSVTSLSGGEKARLTLAVLLYRKPNLLILDEPVNHMDIPARETIESILKAYKGTLLIVTHDRYLADSVADALLIFDQGEVRYYPFSYTHYIERKRNAPDSDPAALRTLKEQALIEGLRAVPKDFRPSLREISTARAANEWDERLTSEDMEAAREDYEAALGLRETARYWEDEEFYKECEVRIEELCRIFTERCIDWYEAGEEDLQ